MSVKPKICLNMIVKNEAHIICETLEAVSPHIQYYVINDTGSTDNTVQVIKDFFTAKGIAGEVIVHEFRTCTCHTGIYKKYDFFHFGWNRTFALQQCLGKSEYIWIIDADDLPVGNFVIPDNLTADCYCLTIGNEFTYQRPQIFKNDASLNWHYVDARHEYADGKSGYTKELLTGDYYIDSRRLGDRSKDTDKYLKDGIIFDTLLKDDPRNERRMFYSAQSYFDYGDTRAGIERYRKRTQMGGWFEEVYYSYYRIADGKALLYDPWTEVEKAYLDAHNYCKDRAEPLYRIAEHYYQEKDYNKCYLFCKRASKIPYPVNCQLFISKDVYQYKIKDTLSIAAYYLGKYMEALSLVKKILEENLFPASQLQRITNNLRLCQEAISNKNKKTCCFYLGNAPLSNNSIVYKIISHAVNYFNVLIVGNKVDPYDITNVIFLTVDVFIKNKDSHRIDYMIVVNSLNYFMDVKLKFTQIILLQEDTYLSLRLNNDCKIGIVNKSKLNSLLSNLTKIVCVTQEHHINFTSLYGLNVDTVTYLGDDYYIMYDDTKFNYQFKNTIDNEHNGLIYIDPPYIKQLTTNLDVYPYAKNIVLQYGEDIIKMYPGQESYYKMAELNISIGNNMTALHNLENALKLSKKNTYIDCILIKKAELLFKNDKYVESYNLANEVLNRNLLPESLRSMAENIRDKNVDYIKDTYLTYPKLKVQNIKNKSDKKILFSMTTCKRYDLFEKTINSFLNTCLDINLIDHWLCVDDNSCSEDRYKMKKNYPFFEFIFKNEQQKGHSVSMNIILDKNIEYISDYNLHMEDDFHFVQKRNYITEAVKVMAECKSIGQVLFNRNYAEVEFYKHPIGGGIHKSTKDGLRYVLHEYYPTDSDEYKQFINRNKNIGTCGYWPHFSFRPSLLRVSTLKDVGCYYNTSHFEMQYAIEYVDKKYVSTFLDTFSCIHIGKKTWENKTSNSYQLNNMGQFNIKNDNLSIHVLSTHDNPTQWKQFKESAKSLPFYTREFPKSVRSLDDYEKKIFNGNDFNYLRSMINYIMDHIRLIKNNKSKYLMVLRDNVIICDTFDDIFDTEFDMILMDQHIKSDDKLVKYDYETQLVLEEMNGYILSQSGIEKILTYVEQYGIKKVPYLNKADILDIYILNRPIYKLNNNKKKQVKPDHFTNLPGYKFYSQLDSFGNDEGYYASRTVKELRNLCDQKSCVAFNTLGYVKTALTDEKDFIYLPNSKDASEGMYVKII